MYSQIALFLICCWDGLLAGLSSSFIQSGADPETHPSSVVLAQPMAWGITTEICLRNTTMITEALVKEGDGHTGTKYGG